MGVDDHKKTSTVEGLEQVHQGGVVSLDVGVVNQKAVSDHIIA